MRGFINGLVFFVLLGCMPILPAARGPVPAEGYRIETLDWTDNLLSGLVEVPEGYLVCDRGQGTVLLLSENTPPQMMLDQLETPVDIAVVGEEWYVLQEIPGNLLSINPKTGKRKEIARDFLHPTAFTVDHEGTIYVVEFETGALLKVEGKNKAMEIGVVLLDRPSDILFMPPDRLAVAEQVGWDGVGGRVRILDLQGEIVHEFHDIIDPTGLALHKDNTLYATVFALPAKPKPEGMGGVVRLKQGQDVHILVRDLLAPTHLLVDSHDRLVVLEEPTDSIYRYTEDLINRSALVEGFGPILQAGLFPDGMVAVIESGILERVRVGGNKKPMATWASPAVGNWQYAVLGVDSLGRMYLADPFQNNLTIYDSLGHVIDTIRGVAPSLMAPTDDGGMAGIVQRGKTLEIQIIYPGDSGKSTKLNWPAVPTAVAMTQNGHLAVAFPDGSVAKAEPTKWSLHPLLPANTSRHIRSIAADPHDPSHLWLLDENGQQVLSYQEKTEELTPILSECDGGFIFPYGEGIYYISQKGKRAILTSNGSAIPSWAMY